MSRCWMRTVGRQPVRLKINSLQKTPHLACAGQLKSSSPEFEPASRAPDPAASGTSGTALFPGCSGNNRVANRMEREKLL